MKKLLLFALLFSINLVAIEKLQSAPTKKNTVEAKTANNQEFIKFWKEFVTNLVNVNETRLNNNSYKKVFLQCEAISPSITVENSIKAISFSLDYFKELNELNKKKEIANLSKLSKIKRINSINDYALNSYFDNEETIIKRLELTGNDLNNIYVLNQSNHYYYYFLKQDKFVFLGLYIRVD